MNEIIKWIDAETDKPDDSISVLVFGNTSATSDHCDVWIGYWDGESDCWRHDKGSRAFLITHWAEMPAGPKEIE